MLKDFTCGDNLRFWTNASLKWWNIKNSAAKLRQVAIQLVSRLKALKHFQIEKQLLLQFYYKNQLQRDSTFANGLHKPQFFIPLGCEGQQWRNNSIKNKSWHVEEWETHFGH